MIQYANDRVAALDAYVPGEQPRGMQYIKLNTNESPFPPSALVSKYVSGEETRFNLYSDPTCAPLVSAASELYGVPPECLIFTNGSDEILNFAFLTFCDAKRGLVFPDITYGLYPVLCEMYGIPYKKLPVGDDFSVNPADYCGLGSNIIIANPNAPSGLCLSCGEIEKILASNPERVVIIDEAYIAFGGTSCVELIGKYENLLITRTFSKSHSLAGARLGMGIGSPELIKQLNKVRYSFNAYSVNRVTMQAGRAALEDNGYYMENCRKIVTTRERLKRELGKLGFELTDSQANFLFVRTPAMNGGALYEELKRRGILIRHFTSQRIADWNRITVGTDEQADALLTELGKII